MLLPLNLLLLLAPTISAAALRPRDTVPRSLVDESSPFVVDLLSEKSENSTQVVKFGNDKFSLEMGPQYGTKLLWNPYGLKSGFDNETVDLVGSAVGLYASYEGALHDLNYTSITITDQTENMIDLSFNAYEGEHHMVLFQGLDGFYSYFVNKNLPTLGEFRTLFRLNPDVYQSGHTTLKDGLLPIFPDDFKGVKTFDETWLAPDNSSYITKYDWSSRTHEEEAFGVYGTYNETGKDYGFWLVSPGRDFYVGDQTKQELMVHRESSTGDVVLLNMLHGTHFEADFVESFPKDKMWGPYLWYFNNGDKADLLRRATKERHNWPYRWLGDKKFQSRGTVKGRLMLSNGQPASNVNLFLGNENYTMVQGAGYQYYSFTDDAGYFEIPHVRTETSYRLQAFGSFWSRYTAADKQLETFLYQKKITVNKDKINDLGTIKWTASDKKFKELWSIGAFDRTTLGFQDGGLKYENMLIESCPSDLTYVIGEDNESNWCYGKGKKGVWTVQFEVDADDVKKDAQLYLSFAGYTGNATFVGGNSTSLAVHVNDVVLDRDRFNTNITNDKSTYRSSSYGGNWYLTSLDVPSGVLTSGTNNVSFITTNSEENKGFMWDSLKFVLKL
ncbi:BA75_03275T0 [Komagataella pastoris]|uniref:rhamnogalacturonan endolyase n=1 Tax=Komagataella pastoris TaxID=4922 RepID=A0A1B2JE04_PICPA|nr:BA75_03275T0 [Komagataella pastoris]